MDNVRIGIVGLGNIGQIHVNNLLEGKVERGVLTAVADAFPDKLPEYEAKGLKTFDSGEALIASGEIDALMIATPHFQHTTLGIAALEVGLHVMVEKPISAHKADAERLVAAAEARPELTFSGMFQMRVEPRYQKIRELVQGGELGDLIRVIWIMTDWFRAEAYYQSSDWRATWKGEGGGVLLNQCLHQLDALQWIVGMPSRVQSHIGIGKHHDIEVEDDVTCYLEYANGASGAFITSTGETPGSNRFEIAGTKGRALLENDKLIVTRNAVPSDEWSRTSKIGFQQPEDDRGGNPHPRRGRCPRETRRQLRQRHPRRRAAHRPRRERHRLRRVGQRDGVLRPAWPSDRPPDGRRRMGGQAKRTHRQLNAREKNRRGQQRRFHRKLPQII